LSAEQRARDEDLDYKEPCFSATYNGFDVHCMVRVEAGDDVPHERLVRYCARPPFALERIERMKDGCVAYRLKTPRRDEQESIAGAGDAGAQHPSSRLISAAGTLI
jgi:hypothetical protein